MEQEKERPLTRDELRGYRQHMAVSLKAAEGRYDRYVALIKRASHQKLDSDKRARDIRRMSAAQDEFIRIRQLVEQIDLELNT